MSTLPTPSPGTRLLLTIALGSQRHTFTADSTAEAAVPSLTPERKKSLRFFLSAHYTLRSHGKPAPHHAQNPVRVGDPAAGAGRRRAVAPVIRSARAQLFMLSKNRYSRLLAPEGTASHISCGSRSFDCAQDFAWRLKRRQYSSRIALLGRFGKRVASKVRHCDSQWLSK